MGAWGEGPRETDTALDHELHVFVAILRWWLLARNWSNGCLRDLRRCRKSHGCLLRGR